MRALIAIAALAAVSACGQQQATTTETPDTTAEMPAPPAPTMMLTEADARSRAETAGYTDVTGLMQNADGSWTATGTKDGQTTQITIGESGVTMATTPAPTP